MDDFKLAHREYVMKILEDATRDKEEMSQVIDECNRYFQEVVGQTHGVLALYFEIKKL